MAIKDYFSYLSIIQQFDLKQFFEILHQLIPVHDVPRLLPEAADQGFAESFDGTKIFWERHGPAPHETDLNPVVLVYGLVCSMNQWRVQVEKFKDEGRPCYLLDFRGHHKSELPANLSFMTLSALGKDIAAVIKDQKLGSAHIWGHSLGVNAVLELALAEPMLCKSLVLVCGTVQDPFKHMLGTHLLDYVIPKFLELHPENNIWLTELWRLIASQVPLTRAVSRLAGFHWTASTLQDVDTYAKAVANVDPRVFFPLLHELTLELSKSTAPKIKVPTLVVAGASDHVTPTSSQKQLASLIPGAQYFEVPAGSHNVQIDFGEYILLKALQFYSTL